MCTKEGGPAQGCNEATRKKGGKKSLIDIE